MVAIIRQILSLITALRGARGFYFEQATTEPSSSSCPPSAPLTTCSTNPVTPDGNEIVPVATIKCGETIGGDTTGSPIVDSNGLSDCGISSGERGLWYKFEDPDACYNTLTFHTCYGATSTPATTLDTKLQVWDDAGCSASAPNCVDGNDDSNCPNNLSLVTINNAASRRYYILVTGKEEDVGTFRVSALCSVR